MAFTYPFPPPTTNTLEPAHRKQLLKSTQKLSALLGTTPRFFEPESDTRAFRREGKVFYNQSASSSQTSVSSNEAESFLWISSSPDIISRQHDRRASTPIAIEFPRAKSRRAEVGHKKSKSSHHQSSIPAPLQLPQPILYRLRSVPSPPPIISPLFADEKVSSVSSPLPPATRTRPNSVTLKPSGKNDLSESDRRRKIAKLARTFGENVPLELVFGQVPENNSFPSESDATTTTTTATATTKVVSSSSRISRRIRSTTVYPLVTEPSSRSNSKDKEHSVPALPQKDDFTSKLPPQAPIITVTTITTDESGTTVTPKRKRRPRSLTLTHITMNQHKDIIIEQDLQLQLQPVRRLGRQPSRSLDEPDRGFCKEAVINLVDQGYRRERDWSGEWNVKDMQEVRSTLRCLRVR